jgi:2-methylcitrate dehydratase PrpD
VDGARSLTFDALPPGVVLVAKTSVLDWLGCALAGSQEPLARMLADEAADQGGAPQAGLVGHEHRTSLQWATLVNGAAAHALDYDDTNFVMMGHPSAPVCPALLALGEAEHAGGSGFLAAYVAGVETECRLGAVLGPGHYAAGWHSTATLGTFGAAAACAHLLGLDEGAWDGAMGLAGVQAAGLKAAFGTMAKPFQVGRAAQSGLLAAGLAGRGFTSPTGILEASQGFAATHAGDAEGKIGDGFLTTATVFKYHASCHLTHSAMEAALVLRHKVALDEVEEVLVLVPDRSLGVCNIAEPATGLEGKFSLRATVAMALLGDDTADPATYTDERMRSPELVAVRHRVTVHGTEEVAGTQATVVVRTAAGEELAETVDVGVPATDFEGQWERITAKFLRLAVPMVGEERAWRLHTLVGGLEKLGDVSELAAVWGSR